MLRFRAGLDEIIPYKPGKSISEVADEYGLTEIHKLASNESPEPPFPEVQELIGRSAATLNRYPDNERRLLRAALAEHLDVPADAVWTGAASNELMLITALGVGGAGTSAVYAWPSFGLYGIATRASFAEPIVVPLDMQHRHDLAAMEKAVRDDTTVVWVCNPNNPTGTHVPADAVEALIDAVPTSTLVVIDEAYHEYATAPDHRSMLPLAVERANVMVTRTFSKAYGLAGLRIGYAVTRPETIAELRRVQLPFTVTTLSELAAVEALRHQDQVAARAQRNAERRTALAAALADRGIDTADSQTNFLYGHLGDDAPDVVEGLLRRGVIVRPAAPAGWVRVTVGDDRENAALLAALDDL